MHTYSNVFTTLGCRYCPSFGVITGLRDRRMYSEHNDLSFIVDNEEKKSPGVMKFDA